MWITIVEDDPNISEIEEYALKSSGYSVSVFDTAREFYAAIAERRPDLVILDVMLPDEDGLSILKKLRSRSDTKRVPILLVTAKTTEMDKVKGLDTGADDYLTKPFGVMELIARVKALIRRVGEPETGALTLGPVHLDTARRLVLVNASPVELTYKEFELLSLLMRNHGIVVPRDTIMERVWKENFEGESRTIDMHIKSLRQKLGEAGKIIRTVRNVGYMAEWKDDNEAQD